METETASEPPMKKMRTESLSDVIDKYVEKFKKCTSAKAVLGFDLNKPLPQVKVSVGHVKNPKDMSKTILLLNERVPLKELSHLKRAKMRDIILCPVDYLNGSLQDFIDKNLPELKDTFEYFKEVDVPAIAPKVKSQFSNMPQLWSLNFHPDKYLESLVNDNFFKKDQIKFHNVCMNMVFEVARWYLRDESSPDILTQVNATVVVDPSVPVIAAVSFCNKDHPTQHSAMLAIDNVAKTQNGGAWGTSTRDIFNCTLSGIDPELQKHLKCLFPKISLGARIFKSKRSVNTVIESVENDDVDTSESPYLCTGYHIYMLREPCLMCSMALVHARAKRIFYCFDNPEAGALKSKVKLQGVPSLNHHFEVFRFELE